MSTKTVIQLLAVLIVGFGMLRVVAADPEYPGETLTSSERGSTATRLSRHAGRRQVRVLVPAFKGPGAVGAEVASVYTLQILRTFRKKDPDQPQGTSFGSGIVIWDENPLPETSPDAAMRKALSLDALAHIVVWGEAFPFGDGVVAESYLAITPLVTASTTRPEVWRIKIPTGANSILLETDLPRFYFAFEPVVLRREVVEQYRSMSRLVMYKDRDLREPVGMVGTGFTATRFLPEAALIRSGGIPGWVPLPPLSDNQLEAFSFAAALVRLLRSDWSGAADRIDKVLRVETAPRSIRIDSLLLRGLAEEKQGRSGIEWFNEAYDLNTLHRRSAQYLIAGLIAEALRVSATRPARERRNTELARIDELFNETAFLFAPDDKWLALARQATQELKARNVQ